ncbi:hypothetical protein ACT3CE_00915 [Marinifilum sp. RC60d5]|uniref:hypothetical protein n=1 Tax=Marinifilum sp. RC60d5 TaxID=3458414 RepID=UPI004036E86C
MKKFCILLSLLVILPVFLKAQKLLSLSGFADFTEGIWLTEGNWANGKSFKQEVDYYWGLNQKIIKVKTYGTINSETNEYGLRNEGIRSYNVKDSVLQFWEFDIYGGITSGTCFFEDKNLNYEYEYNGEFLRETWFYVDKNHYNYQIGSLKDGKIDKVYMKSSYCRVKK